MKKLILVFMSLIMVFSLAACGGGEEAAAEKKELIVGTEAGYAPFEYIGDNGEVVGVDVDIMNAIAEKLGRKLVIKNMSFDGALAAVESGKVDIVAAAVTVTEERKEKMDFSESYVESAEVVVVASANPAVDSTDPKGMEGKVIGVQQGTTADLWASDEANVMPSEVKRYNQIAQGAEDLKNGKIDIIIMDQLPAEELIKSSDGVFSIVEGDPVLVEKTALALPKGSDLLKSVNEVIVELKEEGKIQEFINKHTE